MEIVVDDRAFVVGLSELYRGEMKELEVASLLPLARTACEAMGLTPADVAVEGYYSESSELSTFFRCVRALQAAPARTVTSGPGSDALHRLREVLNSPAMGRSGPSDRLLPRTTSPLGEALRTTTTWSIDDLCRRARLLVREDDAGLVAVAAATGDAVAICAARESVALMEDIESSALLPPSFIWAVSDNVAEVARRFVSSLAVTTRINLPTPGPDAAAPYGRAATEADLTGRCILIGQRDGTQHPQYHWYIDAGTGRAHVRDFWARSVWTTARLRSTPGRSRPSAGARVDA